MILAKFYNKITIVEYIYNRLKTKFFYNFIFGKVGKKSVIFKPLRLINPENILLGDNVYIYKNFRIETLNRWNEDKYFPKIKVGNNVNIEQNLHMTCANEIEIGDNTSILGYVLITDINHDYTDINISSKHQNLIVKEIKIGKSCFIGMGAKILPGTELGDNCIVGSNAVVSGKFPDNSVIAGIPARIIKQYDNSEKKWKKI